MALLTLSFCTYDAKLVTCVITLVILQTAQPKIEVGTGGGMQLTLTPPRFTQQQLAAAAQASAAAVQASSVQQAQQVVQQQVVQHEPVQLKAVSTTGANGVVAGRPTHQTLNLRYNFVTQPPGGGGTSIRGPGGTEIKVVSALPDGTTGRVTQYCLFYLQKGAHNF